MERVSNPRNNQTSLHRVALNMLTSLILVVGALCIEWLKNVFPQESPPKILLAILNLGQITLAIYFLRSLIRALRDVYRELEQFSREIAQSGLWQAIRKPIISFVHFRWVKVIRRHTPNKRDILKRILSGLFASSLIAILSLIIYGLAGIRIGWLILILVLFTIIFLIFFMGTPLFYERERPKPTLLGLNLKGLSAISVGLLSSVIIVLILQLIGKIYILYDILRFLYLRK